MEGSAEPGSAHPLGSWDLSWGRWSPGTQPLPPKAGPSRGCSSVTSGGSPPSRAAPPSVTKRVGPSSSSNINEPAHPASSGQQGQVCQSPRPPTAQAAAHALSGTRGHRERQMPTTEEPWGLEPSPVTTGPAQRGFSGACVPWTVDEPHLAVWPWEPGAQRARCWLADWAPCCPSLEGKPDFAAGKTPGT